MIMIIITITMTINNTYTRAYAVRAIWNSMRPVIWHLASMRSSRLRVQARRRLICYFSVFKLKAIQRRRIAGRKRPEGQFARASAPKQPGRATARASSRKPRSPCHPWHRRWQAVFRPCRETHVLVLLVWVLSKTRNMNGPIDLHLIILILTASSGSARWHALSLSEIRHNGPLNQQPNRTTRLRPRLHLRGRRAGWHSKQPLFESWWYYWYYCWVFGFTIKHSLICYTIIQITVHVYL